MKLFEKVTEIISEETAAPENGEQKEFVRIVDEMKNAGIIRKPVYNLPLVDTIGKTYYLSTNKRK